jgi:hypothetical protein
MNPTPPTEPRDAVIEECARLCDARERKLHNPRDSYEEGARDEADYLGTAIRDLRSGGEKSSG